ncbi:hypothetical protein TNCV_4178151 [Trichonephila clavipes]|nr:hypothetical protein TNCV_4178151 [Trichonephila clavipes]
MRTPPLNHSFAPEKMSPTTFRSDPVGVYYNTVERRLSERNIRTYCCSKKKKKDYRAAILLVRLLEGKERWETSDHPLGVLPQNCGGNNGSDRTVICMVLEAKDNDIRHFALCCDEFHGPRCGI